MSSFMFVHCSMLCEKHLFIPWTGPSGVFLFTINLWNYESI